MSIIPDDDWKGEPITAEDLEYRAVEFEREGKQILANLFRGTATLLRDDGKPPEGSG